MLVYLSIVCPVYHEEKNIPLLIDNISSALRGIDYELIFVDDGSTDQTTECIKYHSIYDSSIRLIALSRNFGQSAAMKAGIDAAEGKYIVTLDGDLQNDPVDILPMLKRMEKEKIWDMVVGKRVNRKDSKWLRKIPSQIANWMIRSSTGVHVHDYGCTLKIFKAPLAKDLELYGELHRFIPVLASLKGARIAEMDVTHHPRINGRSKYGMGRTLKVISDLLLMLFIKKYWARSMHFFGTIGIITVLLGSGINLFLFSLKLMGEDIWGRPLLILGTMLIVSGIQFLFFGFIAEMLFRVYYRPDRVRSYQVKGSEKTVSYSLIHQHLKALPDEKV